MPPIATQVLQTCVVLLLVGFGVRAIYHGARRVPAGPTHTHRIPGAWSSFRVDRWTLARPFLVGAVHGLAGSGALIAIVVTTLPSTMTRLGYLLLFGVGSTVGMAALSGLDGLADGTARCSSRRCACSFSVRRRSLDRARSGLGLSILEDLVSDADVGVHVVDVDGRTRLGAGDCDRRPSPLTPRTDPGSQRGDEYDRRPMEQARQATFKDRLRWRASCRNPSTCVRELT